MLTTGQFPARTYIIATHMFLEINHNELLEVPSGTLKGAPSVAMAAYAEVLFVLGLEQDLLKLGADDEVGRRIQDTGLIVKKRAPKK